MSIRDAGGNELTYWPISGLIEGQDSEPLVITIDVPEDGFLIASEEDKVIVWGREEGVGSYQNLNTDPMPLDGYAGPEQDFEIYVESLPDTITGLERIPISVGAGSSSSAGWTA